MTDTEEKTEEKAEAPKKSHLKKHGGNYARLIAAVTALTAAVNGYLDLAKKNALVYEALASKVNSISTELAQLKGQNEILLEFVKTHMRRGESLPAHRPPAVIPAPTPTAPDEEDTAVEAASDEASADVMVEVTAGAPPKKEKGRFSIDAFQQLPANVGDLVQAQEQLQVQTE